MLPTGEPSYSFITRYFTVVQFWRYASIVKKKADAIVRLICTPQGAITRTLKEELLENTHYALLRLEAVLERHRVDLEHHCESIAADRKDAIREVTLRKAALRKLEEEWVDKIRSNEHNRGPKPKRREQALTALLLHDWLGMSWEEILERFRLRPTEKQSLENRVSELRKALHDCGVQIELEVSPPRGRQPNKSLR